jgi:Ni/Co efflux regulator RcnB
MKRILAAALTVALMAGSVIAEARDHDRSPHARAAHAHKPQHHAHEHRHVDRHVERHVHVDVHHHPRFHAGHYHRPAGYRVYSWRPGMTLPAAYYAPRYVVHDYRAYHLHAPPRGHHWVRVDHDVVLAAIATGAVVAVVNNLFW